MYKNFKIIANTAAGRKRYMRWLIPQVVADDLVDRYDLWVNTTNKEDIAFMEKCAEAFPKINLIYQPDGIVNGIASINAFYKKACDKDAIYIKLDDDLLWLEPGFFDKMVRFRTEHPEYWVVSPLVINNMLSTYVLQVKDKLKFNTYFKPKVDTLIRDGKFAAQLHKWFLSKLTTGTYEELHCGYNSWGLTRFSINSIAWYGADLQTYTGGVIPGDDEEYMSVIKPSELGKSCGLNGDCLCAHFAFYTQRDELDKLDILDAYASYMRGEWENDDKMRPILSKMDEIIDWIEANKAEIASRGIPYTSIAVSKWQRIKNKIG